MNTNTKELNKKELNLNELEQVSGGCPWCIAALASPVVLFGGIGVLIYLSNKK